MTDENTPIEEDEFGEFADPDERVQEASVQEQEDGTEVTLKFPKGVDPKIIQQTMNQVGRMAADRMKAKTSADEKRAEYQANGHRRWKCMVESLQEGVETFELTYPHPSTDKPVTVRGMCGFVLEQGLTKYVIDALNKAYYTTSVKIPNVDPASSLALTHRTVRKPCYRVTVMEEIKNPDKPGRVKSSKLPDSARIVAEAQTAGT